MGDIVVPDVYQDEEASAYWAPGHHEPPLFVLGVITANIRDCGLEEGWEQAVNGAENVRLELADLIGLVERSWWRDTKPGSDQMVPCDESDDGACAFTRLTCG
jgi:hypothetical protein